MEGAACCAFTLPRHRWHVIASPGSVPILRNPPQGRRMLCRAVFGRLGGRLFPPSAGPAPIAIRRLLLWRCGAGSTACECIAQRGFGIREMNWQERVAIDPSVLGGKPVIRGTRLAVEYILELLAAGKTTEDI